jgi:hypothetical protein
VKGDSSSSSGTLNSRRWVKIVRRMSGRMFRSSRRYFWQFRYSQQQEVGEDSKEDVREDVQEFREIVLAVQVLSTAGGG